MNWATFYLVCFLVGFALSALSFVLGSLNIHVHGHVHLDIGHGHGAGHAAHGAGGAHAGGNGAHNADASWFNFGTITAFLAWFGGAGFLLTNYSGFTLGIVILLAVVAGTAGASIMFWFIAKLAKHDRALDARDFDMIGVLGRLSMPIREGGTGEIVFSQEGTRRCAGARSEDGSPIDKRTEVMVTRYEKGIAYVRRWDDQLNLIGGSGERVIGGSEKP